jgi:hypothetical protein
LGIPVRIGDRGGVSGGVGGEVQNKFCTDLGQLSYTPGPSKRGAADCGGLTAVPPIRGNRSSQKSSQKDSFWTTLARILDHFETKSHPRSPRSTPKGPCAAPNGPKDVPRAPSWSPKWAKGRPQRAQGAKRMPKGRRNDPKMDLKTERKNKAAKHRKKTRQRPHSPPLEGLKPSNFIVKRSIPWKSRFSRKVPQHGPKVIKMTKRSPKRIPILTKTAPYIDQKTHQKTNA